MAITFLTSAGCSLIAEDKVQTLEVSEEFAKKAVYAAGDLITKCNLDPYFPKGRFEFQYLGFSSDFVQDENKMTLFLLAQLIAGDKNPQVLFALDVNKADWQIKDITLLSLGDTAVSPQLFCDIIMNPFFSYDSKLMELREGESTHVHIKTEEKAEDAIVQTWTLFNENESCDFTVILELDDKGGTYFTLERL